MLIQLPFREQAHSIPHPAHENKVIIRQRSLPMLAGGTRDLTDVEANQDGHMYLNMVFCWVYILNNVFYLVLLLFF